MLETSAEKPVPVRVVSEAISDYINRLGQIWVEGEIAQLNDRAGSGMVYMRLRDPSVDMYLEVTCPRSVFKAVAPLTDNARRRFICNRTKKATSLSSAKDWINLWPSECG